MNGWLWRWLKRVPRLLEAPRPEPAQHARRILRLQRDVVLPAKLVIIAVVFHYLYQSPWLDEAVNTYGVVLETMRDFFGLYILLNLLVEVSFFVVRRFPTGLVQWVVFALGLVDGIFLGGLTLMTGGFDSILYWGFPGLIVVNALCIPLATPQLVLNLMLSAFFLLAGLLETDFRNIEQPFPQMRPYAARKPRTPITANEIPDPRAVVTRLRRQNDSLSKVLWSRFPEPIHKQLGELMEQPGSTDELQALLVEELNRLLPVSRYVVQSSEPPDNPTEPFFLRLVILWLLAPCCYGVQVLATRQQAAEEEQEEFLAQTTQLRAAGRQAAEFAHQIKNPLAIINAAAFSLQRAVRTHKGNPDQQVQIIQEEVEKADRIITQIMGYAELSEGRVEKLEVREEVDRAIDRVFPTGAEYATVIHRDYAEYFPPLLMQRGHLAEIFANLLQNARDVLDGKGHITVTARCRADYAVEVCVADDGPGIPPDKSERIFEAYYTTRPKGTGLGLAIVKHNVELYGGSVRVESGLGKGARFTVVFPASTAVKLARQS